jgi:plasmid stabilization system protein ParE
MKVRFTRIAQRDLVRIHAYISRDSAMVASRVVAQLIERARLLADNPFQGRTTDEPNARVIVVPRLRYFIFYTIWADEIHVTHIRHTSRHRPSGHDPAMNAD